MKKIFVLGLALACMVLGTAIQSYAQGGPVLEKIWAPKEVNAGQLLKIYVKAKAGDSDMRWVIVGAERGTGAPTASVPIRLGKEFKKELNGYVYMDTRGAAMKNVKGTVYIQIEDYKGNESQEMSAPVALVGKDAKPEKPPADFKEVTIGPAVAPNIQKPGP
jgi:hypothetical protein